jgi:hypothetical protein
MTEVLILFISNILTGISAWIFSRRKQSAETDNLILSNLEKSILLYSQIIESLKLEIESLNIKVQELEGKIDKLHQENKMLKSKL